MESQMPSIESNEERRGILKKFRAAVAELLEQLCHPEKQVPVADPFTNEEVLGHERCQYPPTLHDLHKLNPKLFWLSVNVEKRHDYHDLFLYIRNFAFLKEMRHSRSFYDGLPAFQDGYHDVWVLCRPRSTAVESFTHWSVMTQGHLYHLTATKDTTDNASLQTGIAQQDTSNQDGLVQTTGLLRALLGLGKQKLMTPIAYNHKDWSCPSGKDTIKEEAAQRKKRKKYVAYHVGQTLYNPDQVARLSEAVIGHMKEIGIGSYDFLDNNCQHFVVSLMRRIVMTQRDLKAVGGTRLEIAQWDQCYSGYYLKPWLTKTKARLLWLPTKLTDKWPKRYLPFTVLQPLFLHDSHTTGQVMESTFKTGKVIRNLASLIRDDHPFQKAKAQVKNYTHNHVRWRKLDGRGIFGWYAVVMLVVKMAEIATAMGVQALQWGMATGHAPTTLATILALAPFENIIISGFLAYLVISKTLFARGSLTVKHWDIKRDGNGVHPPRQNLSTRHLSASGGIQGKISELDEDATSVSSEDNAVEDERCWPFTQKLLEEIEPIQMIEAEAGQTLGPLELLESPELPPRSYSEPIAALLNDSAQQSSEILGYKPPLPPRQNTPYNLPERQLLSSTMRSPPPYAPPLPPRR